MAIQTVQHIADVSLKDHFLGAEGAAPANGKITVNHNTFDVTFDDGRVRAKFASGTVFTNMFRSGTLSRFTQTLQAQYDTWLDQQAKIEAAREAEEAVTLGFKDNSDVPRVATVVGEFKAVLEETNPPGKEKYLASLDEIAKLASIRNTLTRNPDGADCDRIVREAGFLTHFKENATKLEDKPKKGYVINMLDTVIGGFLQVASQMTDRKTQVVDFMRNFNGACVEAKGDKNPIFVLNRDTSDRFSREWTSNRRKLMREASKLDNRDEYVNNRLEKDLPDFVRSIRIEISTPPPEDPKKSGKKGADDDKPRKATLKGSHSSIRTMGGPRTVR